MRNNMDDFKPSQGLLELTKIMIESVFDKDTVTELTDENLKALSAVVRSHLLRLPSREHILLVKCFDVGSENTMFDAIADKVVGSEIKELDAISKKLGIAQEHAHRMVRKAFYHLKEASGHDLLLKMYDIIEEAREQS